MKIVDLSHPIVSGMLTYPGLPSPVITEFMTREESREQYEEPTEFQIARIEMVANTGTYVDVPFHRYESGQDLETFPLRKLVDLDGVVIDVTGATERQIDLEPSDVKGRAVLFRTGWSRHWGEDAYRSGPYPFIGEELAGSLVDAGAVLVGIDSLNIDDNRLRSRPAHSILLGAQV
ncbi:MAG: cyclase family protein, partial [Thermoanaerobaculia bacterium]|nr:cyclase family protein [Thermoanaerobaculia bacterium]